MAITDVRARRPRDKEVLVQQLRAEAGFPTIRDVLLFAAALGYQHNRRHSFEESADQVRYETLVDPTFAQTLVSMIAASSTPDDPEILAADRLAERVRAFEEHANGGLDYLQGELNRRREPVDLVCAALVSDALVHTTDKPRPVLSEVVDELTWE